MNLRLLLIAPRTLARLALPGRHTAGPRPKRILMTRVQNLGDCVTFLPTICRVRRHLPETRIDILAGTTVGEQLFGMCRAVDGIIRTEWPARRSFKQKLQEVDLISRGRYDAALISTQETGSAWKIFAAGVPFLAGFDVIYHAGETHREARPFLLNRLLHQPPGMHEVEINLQLASAIGCDDGNIEFGLEPDRVARLSAENILRDNGLDAGSLVFVHAGTKQADKQWPANCFADACDAISSGGLQVAFIGAAEEYRFVEDIRLNMNSRCVNLAGGTSIPELAALFGRARAFLGNDSGPMHLAAACGLPVAAIFLNSDPVVWGPYLTEEKRQVLAPGAANPRDVAKAVLDLAERQAASRAG